METNTQMTQSEHWEIHHPVLRAIAYLAPFCWFGSMYNIDTETDVWLFVVAIYLGITYFALDTAFTVRQHREIRGGIRKTIYVLSVIVVSLVAMVFVAAFGYGVISTL